MHPILAEPRHIDPAWTVIERCRLDLEAQGIFQWDPIYPSRETVARDVADGTLWVLEDEGATLGCVTLDERQDEAYARAAWTSAEPALVVHRLCVDPSAQGRGLARRLMDHAEALAAARGYRSVRLDAYAPNARSLAFYKRRGYREAGTTHFARRTELFYLFELEIG